MATCPFSSAHIKRGLSMIRISMSIYDKNKHASSEIYVTISLISKCRVCRVCCNLQYLLWKCLHFFLSSCLQVISKNCILFLAREDVGVRLYICGTVVPDSSCFKAMNRLRLINEWATKDKDVLRSLLSRSVDFMRRYNYFGTI